MSCSFIRHKIYLFVWLCSYTTAVSFGQAKTNDVQWSMSNMTSISDTLITKELRKAIAIAGKYPDSARYMALVGYQKSKIISYHLGMGQAEIILGNLDHFSGNYDEAIFHFQKAIVHLVNSKFDVRLSVPILSIGNSWFYKGDYHKALANYHRVLSIPEEYGVSISAADSIQAHINIALIWYKVGDISQAKGALKRAERITYLYNDTFLLAQFYNNAANIYTSNNAALALDYLQKSIFITRSKNLTGELIAALNTTASIYNHLGNSDSALSFLREAKSILDLNPTTFRYHRFHYENQLGHALLLKKEYKLAEEILIPLYEALQYKEYYDIRIGLEKNLTALYERTGRIRSALAHSRNYAEIMRTIYDQKNAKVTELWVKLMQEQNQKTLLTKELRIEQQQRTIRARNIWIIGIGTGVLLLGSMLVLLIRNHRHKQKVQQSRLRQLQQQQEIEQLKAQVAGEEKERNRIAVELHDNVGSLLTTAIYSLKTMHEVPEPKTYPQKMEAILKQIQQEIRNTSHILMPDVLLRQSFSESVLEYCAFLERDTGLHIDVQLQGTFEPISKDIKLLFFRILQELLQNIVKHAHAEKVLIQLHASMELISLTVEDDGIGFDPGSDQARGKGFKNIENRLKILNGHISYNTVIGKGTSVYVEASLNVNEQLE